MNLFPRKKLCIIRDYQIVKKFWNEAALLKWAVKKFPGCVIMYCPIPFMEYERKHSLSKIGYFYEEIKDISDMELEIAIAHIGIIT